MHVVYPSTFCITIVFDFPCDDCNTQEEPDWKQWLCKILGAKQDRYRAFSLTWPASMQMYWNKRKRLHKKRVQLPQDWFGTPTWPPFYCFGTPIWPP